MRKVRAFGTIFIAMLFMAIVGCSNAEEVIQEEPKAMPVQVDLVGYGALSASNQFSGTIIAKEDVDVTPKVAGEVVEILVKKGDFVSAGDILAKLDDTNERNALEQEKKRLEQAETGLARAQVGKDRALKNVDQARAALKQAEASLSDAKLNKNQSLESIEYSLESARLAWDEAKKNLERMKALYDDGLISQVEYENAVNGEERARLAYEEVKLSKEQLTQQQSVEAVEASVEQARAGVRIAESAVSEAELGLRDAQTMVEQARLSVQAAEERLADKHIIAPVSGEVISLDLHVGEMAAPQAPFAKIIDIDKVKLSINVTVDKLAHFDVGQQVAVSVPLLEEEREGVISYISSMSSSSGLFTLEVEIDNKDRTLRPGMFASIIVEETLVDEGTIVPTRAIIEKQGESFVFVVENGVAVQKTVEIVRFDTEYTVVTGDIKENDQIVIKGQNLLSDGQPVEVMEGD